MVVTFNTRTTVNNNKKCNWFDDLKTVQNTEIRKRLKATLREHFDIQKTVHSNIFL